MKERSSEREPHYTALLPPSPQHPSFSPLACGPLLNYSLVANPPSPQLIMSDDGRWAQHLQLLSSFCSLNKTRHFLKQLDTRLIIISMLEERTTGSFYALPILSPRTSQSTNETVHVRLISSFTATSLAPSLIQRKVGKYKTKIGKP